MRELNESNTVEPGSSGAGGEAGEHASPVGAIDGEEQSSPVGAIDVEDDVYDHASDNNDEANYESAEDAIRAIDLEEPCTSGVAKTPPSISPPVASPCRLSSPATKGFVPETPSSSHFLSRSLVLTAHSESLYVCLVVLMILFYG